MDARTSTRLWDRGKVYKGDERIAEVVYALEVVQDRVGGIEHQEITGSVRVVEGKRDLMSEGTLILNLAGGRKWEFFASVDQGSGVYSVMDASRASLAPN